MNIKTLNENKEFFKGWHINLSYQPMVFRPYIYLYSKSVLLHILFLVQEAKLEIWIFIRYPQNEKYQNSLGLDSKYTK